MVNPMTTRALATTFASATIFLCCAVHAQERVPDRVGDARATLEKWVEVRRILSQETRDWALGREVLTDRIEIVRREGESLRARIAEAEQGIAEADRKKAELVADNDRLKAAAATLAATVARIEARTRELLPRLPEPLRDRVRPLSQRIPEQPDATKLSLGERFMNVVGVLNEVNKFQREISVTSEVRTLGDGRTAEVSTLYLGLGRAWYATADGRNAGVGSPGANGWTWTPADAIAPAVLRAIAIQRNEQVAAFVRLPVEIQ
jgi:hypothetical protein